MPYEATSLSECPDPDMKYPHLATFGNIHVRQRVTVLQTVHQTLLLLEYPNRVANVQ